MHESGHAGRVAIQHAVAAAAEALSGEYQLLGDVERLLRILDAFVVLELAYLSGGGRVQDRLVELQAETQAWLEALQAGGAR